MPMKAKTMEVDNLYEHLGTPEGDEGLYCLVIDDAPLKNPINGIWMPGVIYIGRDGKMRSCTQERWKQRFKPVAEYTGSDEETIAMIRRTQPSEFDLGDVIGAWHEANVTQTAELLQLMAATVASVGRFADNNLPELDLKWDMNGDAPEGVREVSFTILPRDLAYVSREYTVDAEEIDGGYRFTIRK